MIIRLACHASVFVLSPFIFCRSNVLIYGTTCLTLPAPRSRHTQMAKAQSILLRRLGHPLTLDVAVEKLSYHHSRKSIKTFPLIEWIWRSRVRGTAVRYPFIGLNSNSFIKLGGSLNYWAEKTFSVAKNKIFQTVVWNFLSRILWIISTIFFLFSESSRGLMKPYKQVSDPKVFDHRLFIRLPNYIVATQIKSLECSRRWHEADMKCKQKNFRNVLSPSFWHFDWKWKLYLNLWPIL